MGQDLGGLSRDEAIAVLDSAFSQYSSLPLGLRYGRTVIQLTAASLNVRIDSTATAQRALDAGGEDTWEERLGRFVGRNPRRSVRAVLRFDEAVFQTALQNVAAKVDRPPHDSELKITPEGVTIVPGQAGLLLNKLATGQRVRDRLVSGLVSDVDAVVDEVPPTVRDIHWQGVADIAKLMTSDALLLKHVDKSWSLPRANVVEALLAQRPAGDAQVGTLQWNDAVLGAFVQRIASEVDAAAVDAHVEQQLGKFAVVGGLPGSKVDIAASVERLKVAALRTDRVANLVVSAISPAVVVADWQEAVAVANRTSSKSLTLGFRDRNWTLAGSTIASTLVFTSAVQSGSTRYAVTIDLDQLSTELGKVAKELERPARDARFKLVDGKVALLSDSQEGFKLDLAASAASVARQAFADDRRVELSVSAIQPKVVAADVVNAKFPDLIIEEKTSYAGSIPERAHNVELATERLNGTIIPPGGIFSFNLSVGPTTLAAGYQLGYGITLQDGQAVTVPSEAGGICQVATTIFQSAFWAGLQIVERQGHIYWISRYVSHGMQGLDATVDDPYLDFKFRNNTSGWMLIDSSTDGSTVRFALRGTKPLWEVKVEPPLISGVVPAPTGVVRQNDPTMPIGEELWVEHAEDGFVARVKRTVVQEGRTVDSAEVATAYRPSQNVLLVGTREPTPTATVTPSVIITTTSRVTPSQSPSPAPTVLSREP